MSAEAPSAAQCVVKAQVEVRKILQLQPYPLAQNSEPAIQLVVTGGVDNINFVPGQDQEISLISAEGAVADPPHSRLTLFTQGSGHVQNVTAVPQGGVVEQSPQLSMLETQMSHPAEQMHVITLSKEAIEHLQAHQSPPQPLQIAPRPLQQLQVMQPPIQQLTGATLGPQADLHNQAIHVSTQPISISQTSEQLSSHHIQGQTFQIQAGTVSYLYTTGLPHDS